LKLGDFSVSDKKVNFADTIARKSDASSATQVSTADDTAFDVTGTDYSAGTMAAV